MARRDNERYQSYEKDTFDDPPQGPVGVHRGARPFIVRATPFAIVLIAAVAAGMLFWSIFSGQAARILSNRTSAQETTTQTTSVATSNSSATSESSSASASTSESASASASTSASSDHASQSASQSPSQTPEESQQVNMDAQIRVINGTGVTGYANERTTVLQNAGFTNTTAANPDSTTLPAQTVVYYQNDADLATAQRVANTLGISDVQQSSGISTPIEVILMQ